MKWKQQRQRWRGGVSLPVRGAWIEISILPIRVDLSLSLPVRGAWIEIGVVRLRLAPVPVAPRAGSVD